ncbi:MAG TPA: quinone oxidoreductase [Ensifer sp.]|nr:quinone oxidoreductase [Ensifer sp.]
MDIQIEIREQGAADSLTVSVCPVKTPGPGEIRLRHRAIGVNFVDIYHRSGIYPLPQLPIVPGVEGAGLVEAVGEGVTNVEPGDRVVYGGLPLGAYASTRLLPAWRAIRLPQTVSFELAAASMLRGLTVAMLTGRVFGLGAGQTILVHAGAGGLGQYLTRWSKRLGATVIATVSSAEKAQISRDAGADHVIVGRDADYVTEVLALTGGTGADFIVDGIGGEGFARNFQAIRSFGTVASVGQAGGPIPAIPVAALSARASSLARPSVMAFINDREAYASAAASVFDMIEQGVAGTIGASYPLADAQRAHEDMEGGKTTGSLLLIP